MSSKNDIKEIMIITFTYFGTCYRNFNGMMLGHVAEFKGRSTSHRQTPSLKINIFLKLTFLSLYRSFSAFPNLAI